MSRRFQLLRFFLCLLCCLSAAASVHSFAAETAAPEQEPAPSVVSAHDPAPFAARYPGEADFEAIRAEFFTGRVSARDNGVLWFQNMETIVFEKDDTPYTLETFPGTRLIRRGNGFFVLQKGKENFLGAPVQGYDAERVPWPEVVVADINDDGFPEFFLLDRPGHTDSHYRYVDPYAAGLDDVSLFIPFAGQNPLPSPDPFPDYVFSDGGAGGLPGFTLPELGVEFYQRRGPYYDTERWCFAGRRFYLCEKRRQTYYPASDNNDLIFVRVMRFDYQGNIKAIFCRLLEDGDADAPRLTAMAETPLFSGPAEAPSGQILSPGAVVRILDYRLVEGSEDMRLWYHVRDESDPAREGWCCVTADMPIITDDKLIFAKVHSAGIREYLEHPYSVVSLERTEKGAKALMRKEDGETFFIENIPAVFPYGME